MGDEGAGKGRDDWKPVHIDIESTFTDFVRNFRDGQTLEDVLGKIKPGVLNADFVFRQDGIIAELKCLEKDAGDKDEMTRRFIAAAKHLHYSVEDTQAFALGLKPMPLNLVQRFKNKLREPIGQICKKAVKQIRSSKDLLRMPDAKGLLLVANDNNYGLSPHEIMAEISKYINNHGRGVVDVAVYFTPNVYHDDGSNDGIAKTYWLPSYNVQDDEELPEGLHELINALGRSWLDTEEGFGDPAIQRLETDDITQFVASKPISAFGRTEMGTTRGES